MKIYAENNKMKNSERKKLHYQNNKQKIVCGCGVELLLQTSIRQKHINSKKHQEFIKNSEEKKKSDSCRQNSSLIKNIPNIHLYALGLIKII